MYAPFFPLWVIIYIISHFFNICKGTSGAPVSRSHVRSAHSSVRCRTCHSLVGTNFMPIIFNCVTLYPVHVSVLRTHSVRTGSLLSHTKEIKSVIYIQSCVRPQNMKHPIKHYGRTHGCATTIGHFLYSVHYFNPSANADTTITHYELCITH